MNKLIQNTLSIVLMLSCLFAFGHEGEDHGETKKKTIEAKGYFSSVANSDKYELLLKYQPIEPGEEAVMQLFVSEFNTNKPVDKADIKITSDKNKNLTFTIKQTDIGTYQISTKFPENTAYSLNVAINSALGPDLMVLKNIEAGKELTHSDEETAKKTLLDNPWILFGGGFFLAFLLMLILNRLKNKKANVYFLTLLTLLGSIPLPTRQLYAHGGEEHNDENKKSGNSFSNSFEVPKETQFLFDVYTKKIAIGDFSESTKLFGTIIPASDGHAIITSPQNGRITTLSVSVGQKVKQGQQLAIIEQNIDAASQVNLLAEKNNIDAEFEAAKNEYDRLKTIQDIASKKDVSEAESRYQKALENKKLFNSSSGRTLILKSPIEGVIGNFMFSIGSTINVNEPVFTVTNLSKVYVEAQVFDRDAEKVNAGVKYVVECTNDNHKTAEVKLLALAQNINPTNQSQRVLFEMENKDEAFKIGEFVNISVFASQTQRQLAVPNSAINELNGKPVIFIKDDAEQYSLSYVSLGENNGTYTVIKKGIEEGERIVVNGTYQMKMIYLNQ